MKKFQNKNADDCKNNRADHLLLKLLKQRYKFDKFRYWMTYTSGLMIVFWNKSQQK